MNFNNNLLALFLLSISTMCVFQVTASDNHQNVDDQRIVTLVIVIISQSNSHHHEKALKLQQELYEQVNRIANIRLVVHLSHVDFPHVGGWTFIPLLPQLMHSNPANSSCVLFLQDSTFVNLQRLYAIIVTFENQELFVGYALYDNEPTIIHHFAFYDDPKRFKYPNLASGFLITTQLLQNLSDRITKKEDRKADFSIDAAHELALFIWNEGKGTALTHDPSFCSELSASNLLSCTTYPQPFVPCGDVVRKDELYFAVKTCRKFHNDRLPVVLSTWAKYTKFIKFFSDYRDEHIPTIDIGIPNTEHGHCDKTFAILKYALQDIERLLTEEQVHIKWLVLVDDDTILSVSHIRRLLSCYNSEESTILGERYGYGVHSRKGYNYITGGGGIIISRNLLSLLVQFCDCPSASTPDDMYLGFCLREMGTEIVHSPLFHQARPNDYPDDYLKSYQMNTISFHKHWMIDPVQVYKTWFEKADSVITHQEL